MIEKLFETIKSDILDDGAKLTKATLFESNLNEAIKLKEAELEELNRKEIKEFREELSTQVDEYLTYIVEEFVKDNKKPIVESVKAKQSEKILAIFEELVTTFNMELSDEVITNESEIEALKTKEIINPNNTTDGKK